ncbi:hypothetical protein FRC04_001382 [Tulasnella sp. 424]|nr:hypothetical protein FRC04_001382 [Tulasnella sp. 424]KAG8968820.1 hypothetical protein FRC05_001306 [Tulasnella sp. 425]
MDYVKRVLRTLLCGLVLEQRTINDVCGSQLSLVTLKTEDPEYAVLSVQRLLGDPNPSIDLQNRGRRSGKASLSSLPVEIFLTIVRYVLQDADRDHNAGYYGQVTKLCLVSKRWAETIHGAPELWTNVNLPGSQELLENVIARSGGLDLDIRGYVLSLSKAEMIGSWAHRWRLLDIMPYDEDIMNRLLANPAPRLKKLLLEGLGSWVPPESVFEGTAPKLEVVRLVGCRLPWTSPVLSDLKKLALCRIEDPPDMNALLDILATSQRLTSLEIVLTQIPISPSSRRIELPNLRLFILDYLHHEVMTQILRSIATPLSAKCVFQTALGDEEIIPLEDQLAVVSERLVALAQSVRDSSSTLTLQMGHEESDSLGLSVEEVHQAVLTYNTGARHLGPLSITVISPRKRHIDVLSHLARKIRPYTKSSPPKLRLVDLNRTSPEDKNANLLCALYRTFPNARQITLIDTTYPAMIDALQRLFPQPSPNKSPLFPCLTILTVKRRSHADWAVWLLGHRRRTDKRGVTPLPSQLRMRLEDGSVDAEALQALKQLVPGALSLGNVQIYWTAL